MRTLTFVTTAIILATITINPAHAKDIVKNPESVKSENEAFIRADGLACYFCAYGLERFFKKSGKIASYDMHLKKGIVEIGLIKGKPLVTQDELHKIVYDAGYSPRSTTYKLVGKVRKDGDGYIFKVTDTGQSLPLITTDKLASVIDKTVRLKAKVDKQDGDVMFLEALEIKIITPKVTP
ncbi:hypothetical protein MNBD_NITROSPINAE04-2456 [hydrothermal vent metagenome]|uniref:Uncharacterized protein n=1 Tax=hydrothermal vent metagenome TaxID=652676 RepID=A0A3B1C616_9ZZZZ